MTAEEAIRDLVLDLWDAEDMDRGAEHVRWFLYDVRRAVLEQARDVAPAGSDHIDAGGWHDGYRAGVAAKTKAIEGLMG